MWSIWFYFSPGTFEVTGFESENAAIAALASETWFRDAEGNRVIINESLKRSAVIRICPTE